MANVTLIDQIDKIKAVETVTEKHKLIYEWVKTGKLSFKDYMQLTREVELLLI